MTENEHPAPAARWTDADLLLMWQLGRDYTPAGLAEAADDLRHTPTLAPPALSYEDRVKARIEEMQRHAAAVPEWLKRQRARDLAHDQTCIATGQQHPPAYRDWQDVHDKVSPTVWWRIWWDLNDDLRARLAHLDPGRLPHPAGGDDL